MSLWEGRGGGSIRRLKDPQSSQRQRGLCNQLVQNIAIGPVFFPVQTACSNFVGFFVFFLFVFSSCFYGCDNKMLCVSLFHRSNRDEFLEDVTILHCTAVQLLCDCFVSFSAFVFECEASHCETSKAPQYI